jgi:hypothetical protein
MRLRLCLVVAALLVLGVHAEARDIATICSAEADARGLRGHERVAFRAKCIEGRSRWSDAHRDRYWAEDAAYCLRPMDNAANVLLGACPLCVLVASLAERDGPCHNR